MKTLHSIVVLLSFLALSLFSCQNNTSQTSENQTSNEEKKAQEVNVYTHRHYDSDKQLFEKFTQQTGIKVNVIKASADELMQKLEQEGNNSPADLLITVDAGRLCKAKEKGLLQAISSETLSQNIPAPLRDADNQWFGLTKRARILVYSKERIKPEKLSTYEDLATTKWKGKILTRSSENIYNQSLMASIIANKGEAEAEKWAKGVVGNLAQEPQGKDADQIKAVAAGKGDIAIVNSYYLGKMIGSDDAEGKSAADKVGIFFPNQKDRGAHINVSGAGVCKYAPNKDNAIKLLEFLISEEAQKVFAETEFEYPVRNGVAISPVLQAWGTFKEDTLSLSKLGEFNTKAIMVFDKAGWK